MAALQVYKVLSRGMAYWCVCPLQAACRILTGQSASSTRRMLPCCRRRAAVYDNVGALKSQHCLLRPPLGHKVCNQVAIRQHRHLFRHLCAAATAGASAACAGAAAAVVAAATVGACAACADAASAMVAAGAQDSAVGEEAGEDAAGHDCKRQGGLERIISAASGGGASMQG